MSTPHAASPGMGRGLLSGLATTARALARPAHTREYPDVKPALPPRSRGVIALQEENCTSCMLCGRSCPDWCIYIEAHKEMAPPRRGWQAKVNKLDRFDIDYALCMYCGICTRSARSTRCSEPDFETRDRRPNAAREERLGLDAALPRPVA